MLRTRTDITIKPADKRSATVVMSKRDYVVKVMSHVHLENENFYRRLDEDPIERFAEEVTFVLLGMTHRFAISKEIFNYLRPQKPRTCRFYALPKIHKEGILGRLTASPCGAAIEKISQFVDYILKPLVAKTPSYIKDTTDFLLKLKSVGKVPPGSQLVTLDVRSFHNNIPHTEGIAACRELLNTRSVQEPSTEDFVKLITLILTKNNFSFNNEHYLQLKGMAIGTCMAPS